MTHLNTIKTLAILYFVSISTVFAFDKPKGCWSGQTPSDSKEICYKICFNLDSTLSHETLIIRYFPDTTIFEHKENSDIISSIDSLSIITSKMDTLNYHINSNTLNINTGVSSTIYFNDDSYSTCVKNTGFKK